MVTKSGMTELYSKTVDGREHGQREANALLKLAMMAKEDVATGRVHSKKEVFERLRAARLN